MALRVRVCSTIDVLPGEHRAFEVEGVAVPVLVANVGGRYLATTSMCPHEDVSLEPGPLTGTRIVCPGHAYEFDLATGRCTHDPILRLRTYRVEIEGDAVFVQLI